MLPKICYYLITTKTTIFFFPSTHIKPLFGNKNYTSNKCLSKTFERMKVMFRTQEGSAKQKQALICCFCHLVSWRGSQQA